MAITINGVLCQEIVNGYSEHVDLLRGPIARKGFLCNWGDRFKVAVGLLGLSSTVSIGGVITLQAPAKHPELTTTYARSIEIEGKGSPVQGAKQLAFPYAIVWCNYSTMPWSFSALDNPFNQIDPLHPYTFAEQRLSSSVEWIQVPGQGCRWGTTNKPLQQDGAFPIWLVEMEISLKNLPYMPSAEAITYTGLINSTLYLGVNPGSLVYGGVTTQQQAVSDGTFVQEAAYKFTARQYRWDYQFDPAQKKFDQVKINGQPMIAAVDLSLVIPSYYGY